MWILFKEVSFLLFKKERRVMFMDLNYAIFRSEPINNLNDLAQIGLHNKREKKAYFESSESIFRLF